MTLIDLVQLQKQVIKLSQRFYQALLYLLLNNMSLKELNLKEFLEHKTLYYDKIDYSYIKKSADILLSHIKLPFTIHIVGTNGKGSTGRFLAFYLYKNGYKTLHYSSPHIKEFNERIWLNGADI